MTAIPTKFAIVEAAWGAQNGHIYSTTDQDVRYHKTEAAARKEATEMIKDGSKMVAIMEIKALLVPSTEAVEIV